jgi:hypothetical protein
MKTFLISFFIFIKSGLYGQDTTSDMLLGKWAVCYDSKFSENYSCEHPFTTYELSQGGNYIGEETICMDKNIPQQVLGSLKMGI